LDPSHSLVKALGQRCDQEREVTEFPETANNKDVTAACSHEHTRAKLNFWLLDRRRKCLKLEINR